MLSISYGMITSKPRNVSKSMFTNLKKGLIYLNFWDSKSPCLNFIDIMQLDYAIKGPISDKKLIIRAIK